MTLDIFLTHFQHVRPSKKGWTAQCPAHDDRSRHTLKIGLGATGKRLLHCWANCRIDEILTAAQLAPTDLFAPGSEKVRILKPTPPGSYRAALKRQLEEQRRLLTLDVLDAYHESDLVRHASTTAHAVRSQVTRLGDTDAAWILAEQAATLDRQAMTL